jgi:hypothetical protein
MIGSFGLAKTRFKVSLFEPDLSTEEDEQYPGHGENRCDQETSQDRVPGELPGLSLGHLVTLVYPVRLAVLPADASVMPSHAFHVHIANDPAVIVFKLFWFVCH